MKLKYDNSAQSFIEDEFDFMLSRSKKTTQKNVSVQVKHKKTEDTNTAPLEIKSSKVEPAKIESLKAESLEDKPLKAKLSETKALNTGYSKVDLSESAPEEVLHQEEQHTDFVSRKDKRDVYIIMAIRFVIMPLIAFALTFWLYSMIDNLISHYQYQRFSTTVNAPPN